MSRHVLSLTASSAGPAEVPDGVYLAQGMQRSHISICHSGCWHHATEPSLHSGRLYAARKALWKLNWFLREFSYDEQPLAQDDVTKMSYRGVEIGHVAIKGPLT